MVEAASAMSLTTPEQIEVAPAQERGVSAKASPKSITGDNAAVRSGEVTCPYCGVGCRMRLEASGQRLLRTKGLAEARANQGRLCPKGALAVNPVQHPDRLTKPLIRSVDGQFRKVTWDEALGEIARRFTMIRRDHGPDALAWYGSGQLDTEAIYVAMKLFKGALGTNNTDANSRLCMASAAQSYKIQLGSDGPPTCYDDLHLAHAALIIGSNMAETHPVLFQEWEIQRKKRGVKTVVVDPRRSATARAGDLHVPIQPGGDIPFLLALAKRLHDLDAFDADFLAKRTEGSEYFLRQLDGVDLDLYCAKAGIHRDLLNNAAGFLANHTPWLSFYCQGLAQSREGLAKHHALLNLHLATGMLARPGAGPFSLTGQPNAMGGREVGYLAGGLPGYRDVANPAHRDEMESIWNLPMGHLSARHGPPAVEMFRNMEHGRIRGMVIQCTNPAVSMPDLAGIRLAFCSGATVVAIDCYETETTKWADFVLPAAMFAEKDGTSTNSERMVSYSEAMVAPPGEARPDWAILADLGKHMGFDGFEYRNSGQIWDEWIRCTAGRPCEMTAMTRGELMRRREMQWPWKMGDAGPVARRFVEGSFDTPSGRARFVPVEYQGPARKPDAKRPLRLTSGRLASHWHTRTRTGRVPYFHRQADAPYIEMSISDAAQRGIIEGEKVTLVSAAGCIAVRVRLSPDLTPGLLFAPIHWGDGDDGRVAVNNLFEAQVDPGTGQPELKHTTVDLIPSLGNKMMGGDGHDSSQ